MSILHWPKAERPQEKLLSQGAHHLSDAELLAVFLRTGIKGKSVLDVARSALAKFGHWRGLLEAPQLEFCDTAGLGVVKYVQLQAALEISKRHLFSTLVRGDILHNPSDTQRFLLAKLRHYTHEVFACLYLDVRHRVTHFAELFHGTLDNTQIHPREVIKSALAHNAAAVIFAHNHPSGNAEPSSADIVVTQQLKAALDLVDIRVLDHIIIGDAEVVSFAKRGYV